MKIKISSFLILFLILMSACKPAASVETQTETSVSMTLTKTPLPTKAPTLTATLLPQTQTSTSLPTRTATPTQTATLTQLPPLPASIGVIAFASMQGNEWKIYVVNTDGRGKEQVTVGVKGGYEPNWSPDGTKIVFQYGGFKIADLVQRVIVDIPLNLESSKLENQYLVKPAWSPDGKWIAFLNESGMQGDIYLIRPDGTNLKRLTESNDISRDGNLVWSPDSKRLAYSANRAGSSNIYVIDIEVALQGNATSQQLTNSPSPIRNLVTSWSPDGARLAFSSDRDHNTEIYIMNADGSNVLRLTNNPASDTESDWSPDGKWIAFSSNRAGNFDIYILDVEQAILNLDASALWRLTDYPGDDVGPKWKPEP